MSEVPSDSASESHRDAVAVAEEAEDQHAYLPVSGVRFLPALPAMARLGRRYVAAQWIREQVLADQRERLARFLNRAVALVPAYQGVEIGIDPIVSLSVFPLLNKHQIQEQFEEYVSDAIDPSVAYRVKTSGSTGTPLEVLHDLADFTHEIATFERIIESVGLQRGESVARIVSDRSRPMWRVEAQIFLATTTLATVNLLDESQKWCIENVRRLAAFRPAGLFGNPSDLVALAHLVGDTGVRLDSVRFAITGGENLTANMRAVIVEAFGCRLVNNYAMQEGRNIAWECEEGTLHINEDRVFLEQVANGELAATFFTNGVMPLIRYRTGDYGSVVTPEERPCQCGRQLSSLTGFEGRQRGFIVFPDGRLYSPKPLKIFLTEQPLALWQLVQRDPEALEVFLVERRDVHVDATLIAATLSRMLNNEIRVTARVVNPEAVFQNGTKFQMMRLDAYQVIRPSGE